MAGQSLGDNLEQHKNTKPNKALLYLLQHSRAPSADRHEV